MAAERNPYYSTNGAAAYDVYSVENTLRQPVREPERHELPQERELPRKRQRVRARTAVAPFTILGAAISACMMILVIFGYVQLFEATSEVSKLENQLSALQSQQTQLQSRYEARIDLDAISAEAGTLGLSKPSQEQIVYVNLAGTDQAEIYKTEKSSILSEIIGAVEQSISDLIAYLHPAAA